MTRPLRITYSGALYHITARGNEKKDIFFSDSDRSRFLTTLGNVVRSYNWICHGYCLMDNHYHLLIETPEGNLSEGMRQLNGMYTQSMNKVRGRVGHLFQGRFKAFLVEQETYLREVARYIVLNPVRAKIARRPEDWRWSSYRAMVGIRAVPDFLTTQNILRRFSSTKKIAIQRYRDFVYEGIGARSPFHNVQHGTLLGSQQFVDAMWQANDTSHLTEVSKENRIIGRPSLKDLFSGKPSKKVRNHMICVARDQCGYPMIEIAKALKIHYSSVTRIYKMSNNKT